MLFSKHREQDLMLPTFSLEFYPIIRKLGQLRTHGREHPLRTFPFPRSLGRHYLRKGVPVPLLHWEVVHVYKRMYKHACAKQPRVDFNRNSTLHRSILLLILPPQHQKSILTELYLRHCNRLTFSLWERKGINNLGFTVFTYVPKAIYVDVYLCVCWRMRVGAVWKGL